LKVLKTAKYIGQMDRIILQRKNAKGPFCDFLPRIFEMEGKSARESIARRAENPYASDEENHVSFAFLI